MASILPVGGKWRALIRRKGAKPECKTFTTKAAAEAWARSREVRIDKGIVDQPESVLTVRKVIQAYRDLRARTRPIADGHSEVYLLNGLERVLGDKLADKLTVDDLVTFAIQRRDEGAGGYTINIDLSKLGTVFRYGGAALKVVLPDVVRTARPTLTYLRLIEGGGKRERRPTGDETTRVLARLLEQNGPVAHDAIEFAIITAMRRGEVVSLRRGDLDEATRTASVQRKHPRLGKTLERVPLLGRAWDIAQAQPKVEGDDRVFPILDETLSKQFRKACRHLTIENLRLHDLRHEGTSALFEAGYTIEQVALVTVHKSWANLKRYTNLRPEDLHAVLDDQRNASQIDQAANEITVPSVAQKRR